MLKALEEYGKFVEICGFRKPQINDAKAFLDTLSKDLPAGVEVQLFNADLVATWQHLYFAALNALVAFKTNRSLSKSLAVESALYASAQRQIKKAIELIGIKPETENVAVMVMGSDAFSVETGFLAVAKRMGVEPDEAVLELSEAKTQKIRSAFDVSDVELATVSSRSDVRQTLVDLVVERVALLSTQL
ncbi:MAG: KEOPS complex subunit Cgi121 [Candidatus Bathyarchaeota archaeon]|nr:KEOPS complex subunit Cgi121 [Candidatus Bathyarchaeota archaeon]